MRFPNITTLILVFYFPYMCIYNIYIHINKENKIVYYIYEFIRNIRNFLVYFLFALIFLFFTLILFMNVLFSIVLLQINLLTYSGNMEHFNTSSNEPAKSYQVLVPFSASYNCLIRPLILFIHVIKAILSAKNIAIYANNNNNAFIFPT